jgi:hypothetical protein
MSPIPKPAVKDLQGAGNTPAENKATMPPAGALMAAARNKTNFFHHSLVKGRGPRARADLSTPPGNQPTSVINGQSTTTTKIARSVCSHAQRPCITDAKLNRKLLSAA